jgi:polysaccharide export outer membrane protein
MVVDFDRILNGDGLPLPLKDGDIVYVPRNSFGTWNDAIAEMLPSLQFVASVLQPFVQLKFLLDETN